MITNNIKNMDKLPSYLQDEDMLKTLDSWGYGVEPFANEGFVLVIDDVAYPFDNLQDFLGKEIDENGYGILGIWETRAIYSARQAEKILNEGKDGHTYIAEYREDTIW